MRRGAGGGTRAYFSQPEERRAETGSFTVFPFVVFSPHIRASGAIRYKRYSEFSALHRLMFEQAAGLSLALPALPPKLLRVSQEQLEERRQGLCALLEAVLERPELCTLPCVREFLLVPEPGPERHSTSVHVVRPEQRVCSVCSEHAPAEIKARASLLRRPEWRLAREHSDEAFASTGGGDATARPRMTRMRCQGCAPPSSPFPLTASDDGVADVTDDVTDDVHGGPDLGGLVPVDRRAREAARRPPRALRRGVSS
jgi:hypothetical protein